MTTADSAAAYFIAQLSVPDLERYRTEYGRRVVEQLASIGAEVLVGTGDPTVLEGGWPATWTVVIRFKDRKSALEWYNGPEYGPLKQLRLQVLTRGGNIILADAFKPRQPVG